MTCQASQNILDIEHLSLRFGAVVASDDLSLQVRPGEIHALIGPNGAGKTTLISQIYGALRPDKGHIFLDGEDITHLSVTQRVHKGLSRSFQISNVLMDFTVLENAIITAQAISHKAFCFFKPAFSDSELIEQAIQILGPVGLADKGHMPVNSLSHGERRLLELGLAMAGTPKLLLLDEPLAGSGAQESHFMTEVIASLKGRTSILLIEHDMDAVFQLADRLTVLVEGQSIACGTAQEISASPDVRLAYLGSEV